MDADTCCLEFESVCGIVREGCSDLCCGVYEWNVFVHEGGEATTTPACSVMSKKCVIRKLECVVSVGVEVSFLNQCYVFVLIV